MSPLPKRQLCQVDAYRSCKSRDITFLFCQATPRDHITKRLCDLVSGNAYHAVEFQVSIPQCLPYCWPNIRILLNDLLADLKISFPPKQTTNTRFFHKFFRNFDKIIFSKIVQINIRKFSRTFFGNMDPWTWNNLQNIKTTISRKCYFFWSTLNRYSFSLPIYNSFKIPVTEVVNHSMELGLLLL